MSEGGIPRLAVVLATDRYETIRPVIRHLQRQTIRDQIEIVIVTEASPAIALSPAGNTCSQRP